MATSEDDHVPVRDGHSQHPRYTPPEEMYWLSHMDQEELREKYVKLKDDFHTLKKFSCRQEDKIKQLQTKLHRLIADRKKDGGSVGSQAMRIQEIEHQETVEAQQQMIRELKLKNGQIEKKLKLANVQLSTAMKKKPMLFRNVGPRVDSGLKQSRPAQNITPKQRVRPKSSPPKILTSEESSCILSPESVKQVDQVLPERVREILEEARERILGLEAERNDFQEQISDMQQTAEDNEYEWQQKLSALEEEIAGLRQDLRERGVREEKDSVAIIRAQREAHTLTARSTALQEQLVLTEEKVIAEKSRSNSLQTEIERLNSKLHTCENQSKEYHQELQHVKGELQQITEKYTIVKRENEQLQKENDRITKLSLSTERRGQTSEVESLKLQIAQLESALQSDLSERGVFLEHMTRDKEGLAKYEVELKELRTKNLELLEELEKLRLKLNIYDKAGLLDLTEKDLATAQSLKKESHVDEAYIKELENLRRAHSELQLLNREKSLELEQTSQALARHADTYKNLQAEIEKVSQDSKQTEQDLNATIRSLQDTIKRRDERSEKLEQQMLILTDKNVKNKLEGLSHNLAQNVKLSKHDNVLEFHIESISYEANEFSQLKTFVSWTVPFSLEDPLQHTNVAIGKFASFNYSSLYKFQMNYRNLESLREDTVVASVYILLESGHPAKIGECHLTFSEVLEHPRNTLHGTVPVMVAHDDAEEVKHLPSQLQLQIGQGIGTLCYWFRLLRPCEEVIAQHLRNVGALSSSKYHEDHRPLKTSSMIKAENPVASKRREKTPATIEQKSPTPSPPGMSYKPVQSEARPSPSPRSHHPSPSPALPLDEHEPPECVENKMALEEIQATSSKDKNRKTGTTRVKSEGLSTVKENVEQEPSRTSSPSSTGTYNVVSPVHKPLRIGSPSSVGTYNVGSPTQHTGENHSSRSNSSEVEEDCNSPEIRKASGSKSVPSGRISKMGHLESTKKLLRVKSAAPAKPPRTYAAQEDRLSAESRISSTRDKEQISKTEVLSTEDSASSEQEGNDTMFEETASSSESTVDSFQDRIYRERKSDTSSKKEYQSRKVTDKKFSKNAQGRQIQQLKTHSRNSNSSQSADHRSSPSRMSITSDSEGVVAVVPKTVKAKHDTIFIEVCSLTLIAEATITQDPMVEFLFVDYHGFLGLPPEQLETPQSLPKPPPGCTLNFNFGQEFSVNEKIYPMRRQALVELMRNRGLIKFTVTSEPPEELQDTHDCQDLGYAFVNLHDLLKRGHDLHEQDLVVENADDGSGMGTLCITLNILHVLRNLEI